ncbi:uncharacterized protein LOC111625401 [Centruroides sculpturatus]|uniref:uncharacterized protein LOC111625401 n=1 Tax=Centruroides sculpturatus TaxID=218467 RepID=UPI000C6D48B1|nr:uncharacterized protein LOC111625401 [Centruroides sculpturatus]
MVLKCIYLLVSSVTEENLEIFIDNSLYSIHYSYLIILGIWNVYLKFQQKQLKEVKLPNAKQWLPVLKDYLENHILNLHILQELSLRLNTEYLPGIGISVNSLDGIYNGKNHNSIINIQEQSFQLCSQTPDYIYSPSESQDQSILPSRIFCLSPTLGTSGEVILKRERKYIRSPLLNDPLCSPNLRDSNNRRKSPVIQLEKIGQKQTTKVIWHSNCSSNENLSDSSVRNIDSYYSAAYNHANRSDSILSTNSRKQLMNVFNEEKEFSTVDCNVKSKFAEKIVESVLNGSESDSFENVPSYSVDNLTPDLFERSAFITRDKLKRTPVDSSIINSNCQQHEEIDASINSAKMLSQSLNNSVQEMQSMFDDIFTSTERDSKSLDLSSKDLINVSWNEDELLSKVTMPEVPLFDITDGPYNIKHNDDCSFSSIIIQYNDLKETGICLQD